ncbi:MAG: hypothetical protein Q4A23_02410 [bacterium]|nr:hypothetical protein [bacterium]
MEKVAFNSLNFVLLHELDEGKQAEIINFISAYTYADEHLLDTTPDELKEKLCLALLLDDYGNFVSCAGLMTPEMNDLGLMMAEVGTMITVDRWRKQGCASYLLEQLDAWANRNPEINGTYALISEKSRDLVVAAGYRGTALFRGKVLNAAEFLPQVATDLCRTVCGHRNKIRLMDLSEKDPGLLSESEKKELALAKKAREQKFQKEIDKINKNILLTSDIRKIETYESVIQAYKDNLENNLWCCDFVVVKIFN